MMQALSQNNFSNQEGTPIITLDFLPACPAYSRMPNAGIRRATALGFDSSSHVKSATPAKAGH